MIILRNTIKKQDVLIQRPYMDNDIQRSTYLKSSDLKTLNNESLVGSGNISIPVVTKTSDLINDSGFIDSEGLDNYALKSDVPTKTSELTNDSGYIDQSGLSNYALKTEIPTKTSQLTNDSGYLTEHQSLEEYYTKTQTDTKLKDYALKSSVPTKTSQLTNDSGYIDSTALSPYAKTSDVNTELEKKADKSSIPTKTSQLTNDSDYTTKEYVDSSISTALGTIETKLSLI